MAVPAEAADDVVAGLMRVAADDVLRRASEKKGVGNGGRRLKEIKRARRAHLDGTGEDVAIVRQAGRKGWAVVKRPRLAALREAKRLLEGAVLLPPREDLLLLFGRVDRDGHCERELAGECVRRCVAFRWQGFYRR